MANHNNINLVWITIIIVSLNISSASSLQFEFSRFNTSQDEIFYQGDATPNGQGGIQLTNPERVFRVGWASYAKKVPIWDLESSQVSDFSTHFTFVIDLLNRTAYGDGLSFFLAPFGSTIPLNSAGEYLGLVNTTSSDASRNIFVAVEFDTFANFGAYDPPFEHVGIDVNTLNSVVTKPWNSSMHSGNVIDVWIMYNSSTNDLTVDWANKTQPNSTLAYKVDLRNVLPQWVMVGFAAATGLGVENHVIQSWEFSSSLDVKEHNETTTTTRSGRDIILILGLSLSIGPIMILILVAIAIKAKACRYKAKDHVEPNFTDGDLERRLGPHAFSYADLALATNNFSKDRKLGQGGFGIVYKGYLIDRDLLIAVKKILKRSKQGRKEYATEVKVISQLRHRNLVQLIGWCHDHRDEFLLVYEFMSNGSLDAHLFGKKDMLSWATRHRIVLGLTSAILYLHEEWEQCVIHRDIKPSNIMLDSNFNAKLGDFGLAKISDHKHDPTMSAQAGTLGYMAPEYLRTCRASKESDIYSFGVVVLEIVTGRQCRDAKLAEFQMTLVEWAWNLYGKGKVVDIVDERLNRELNGKEVECLVIVGLWCAHPDPSLRPSIKHVMRVLSFDSPLPDLPPNMPIPTYCVPEESTTLMVTSHEPMISSSSMQVGR